MAKSDYINPNDEAFNAQLQTFQAGIGNYSAILGVTPAQIASQAADAAYFDYCLQCLALMSNGGQQWTAWKNLERDGGTPPASGAPVAPTFPPAVPAVAPGIEVRFRALVQLIKANDNYNAAIGQALGIEGPDHTGPDLTTIQPVIGATISGGHVLVKWGWGGNSAYLDMCELQVDRGDGNGYVLLAYDTTPNYNDTQPFPAAPVKWTYRGIYRVGDSRVGQWSLPVSVTAGG
ncbi:MAG: hypothetical protein HY043_03160 [Verrucomicrobia bacterium]|nr:hypothetical protein [Verrucomicrobiota bacterium]